MNTMVNGVFAEAPNPARKPIDPIQFSLRSLSSALLADLIQGVQYQPLIRALAMCAFGQHATPKASARSPCKESKHMTRDGMEPPARGNMRFDVRYHELSRLKRAGARVLFTEHPSIYVAKNVPG